MTTSLDRSWLRKALCLLLFPLLVTTGCSPARSGLPSTIQADDLAQPTFDERFETFDHGQDQLRPRGTPHRWRTVFGYGGPLSFDNRKFSGTSFASDAEFGGVANGRLLEGSLGLDPFAHEPGSMLRIRAERVPARLQAYVWGKPYYGGLISTRFSFRQLFGYFEVEARLPDGKGMWPAFWLLPVRGQWPKNGELDIFEGLGDPKVIYATVHSGRQEPVQEKVELLFDASKSFHRYGAAWSKDEIVWYVDRKEIARTATPADMKRTPMFILLNLGVGGPWGGYPDASTRWPGTFDLRRVTVWRLPPTR